MRLYATSLRLLPSELRALHGAEMRRDFERLVRTAGRAMATLLLLRCLADVVAQAANERLWARRAGPRRGASRRSVRTGERIMDWWHEVQLGVRSLAKRPGFTTIAVITLALGIGATAAIFAVVNAVLIRPLPYPDSERVVWFGHHAPGLGLPDLANSEVTVALYEEHARSFAYVASVSETARNLTGGEAPARVDVAIVTPSLFDVLAVAPVRGRRFVEADAAPGAPAVAMITHTAWTSHFGRRDDILGQVVELDGVSTEIVGVMPSDFVFPASETAALLPRTRTADPIFGSFGLTGLARLAAGATLASARAEVSGLQNRLLEIVDDLTPEFFQQAGWSVSVELLRDEIVGEVRTALWVVLGTVGFLLLVACASVANLFLVRAESRQREVGIRFALGATRRRVAGNFLAESLLLAALGGGVGGLLAWAGVRALIAAAPAQLPRLHEVGVDPTVVLFIGSVSIVAGLVFGLLPLPQHMRSPLRSIVREGRGQTGGRERQRLRKALIVAQIGLSLVLLTGSGLMLRSFQRLLSVDPGIRPDDVLAIGVSTGETGERRSKAALYERLVDEVRALPGVQAAAATNALPFDPTEVNGSSFNIESRPIPEEEIAPVAMFSSVSDGYFEGMGTPVLEGRDIERGDSEHGRPVVWVNETLARDFLGGRAIGERIRFGSDSTWLEIVGVVRDVRTFGLREDSRPQAYLPLNTSVASARIGMVQLVVRTAGNPIALAPSVRDVVRRVSPDVPLTTARTMRSVLSDSLSETSFTLTILIVAAVVSLLLGAIGLYGVIGYVVSQRTQEIGVRIALGALPATVRRMVLRQGLTLAIIGVVAGLAGAAALTRLLDSLLFEVSARDPLTFVLVPSALFAVAALAAYVPAARAARIDPMHALRTE